MSKITFSIVNNSTNENLRVKLKSLNGSPLTIEYGSDTFYEAYIPNQKYAVCLSPNVTISCDGATSSAFFKITDASSIDLIVDNHIYSDLDINTVKSILATVGVDFVPMYYKTPTLLTETQTINRFDPLYWRIDGPQTASFAITDYQNGWEATFQCRQTDDLVGIIWDSENTKDHKYLAYETNFDYRNLIWEFDIELSDTMPVLNDPKYAPTLTIIYENQAGFKSYAYVALWNYADKPASRSAHIKIDWNNIRGGYAADIPFTPSNVKQMFFGGYVTGYDKANVDKFDETKNGYVRVINSVVTGTNSTLNISRVIVDPHDVGMCTSYDDHYDLNPRRIVNNLECLGYNGFINHYCGMSHYPIINWNKDLNRFEIPDILVDGGDVVNPACRKWHEQYAKSLHAANMEPVFSVSWELYSLGAREVWCQREWNDTIGRTGYEPPSYFMSMCHENAIAYIHKAYREFADTLVFGGCEVIMQIGEPWWWFNVASLNPCVYDYQTRLAFNADTGLYAPDLGNIFEAVTKTGTPYDEFKLWLRNKLGQTCQNIRTMLKEYYNVSTQKEKIIKGLSDTDFKNWQAVTNAINYLTTNKATSWTWNNKTKTVSWTGVEENWQITTNYWGVKTEPSAYRCCWLYSIINAQWDYADPMYTLNAQGTEGVCHIKHISSGDVLDNGYLKRLSSAPANGTLTFDQIATRIIASSQGSDTGQGLLADIFIEEIENTYKDYLGEVKVCPLIFFPSIRTHQVSLATYINYPKEYYAYPNFDFIMTEAYDWVIEQPPRLDLSHQAVNEIPIEELGYPVDKIAYLSGFVPDSMIAYIYKFNYKSNYRKPIWQRIFGDMKNNRPVGIWKQLVWAYPQVMFDSITVDRVKAPRGFFMADKYVLPISDNTPYPPEIFDDNAQPPEPSPIQQPVNVLAFKNSWGDVRITFDVNNYKVGTKFEVQVLNSAGIYPLWTQVTEDKFVNISVNELATANISGSLKIVVIPSDGDNSVVLDIDPVLNDNFVNTVIFFAGQSHALAHFTALSGANAKHDLVSATTLRNKYAQEKNVHPATVLPVAIAWGSSAADKLGQSDTNINDTNYWYDLDADVNGTRLNQALATIDQYASIPNKLLLWSQGSADADASGLPPPLLSNTTRYTNATKKILQKLLAVLPATTKVYWQILGRKYNGVVPQEVFGLERYNYRQAQISLITEDTRSVVGSWTIGGERSSGYINEQNIWAHHTPAVYHSIAKDIGEAMGKGLDRIDSPPLWITLNPVQDIVASRSGEDIVVEWSANTNYNKYFVTQYNVLDGSVIYSREATGTSDTFTAAEQRAVYEYTAGTIKVSVVGYNIANDVYGPTVTYNHTF